MDVYRVKGGRLQGKKKMPCEPSKHQGLLKRRLLILRLKVDVYRVKRGNFIDQKSTIMLK